MINSKRIVNMKCGLITSIFFALTLQGCVSDGPKTVLIDNAASVAEAAIVHPTKVPGGFMLIQEVDGKSTYVMSIGFLGALYVPPGDHLFKVEVSHGFWIQDPGGPEWTAPANMKTAPLINNGFTGIVTKGYSNLAGAVQSGKIYELKFGFDRSDKDKPAPVVWLAELP
jgi:hypothetical protein